MDNYGGLIDLQDVGDRAGADRETILLSRSLAAYGLASVAEISASEAAACVTDGGNDNGIDAIYFHQTTMTLYIVQSKWSASGHNTPGQAEVLTFTAGLDDLIDCKLDRFNAKLRRHEATIRDALKEANLRYRILLVHTGLNRIGPHARRRLEDQVRKLNDPIVSAAYQELSQKDVHEFVAAANDAATIDFDVTLQDWGTSQDPYVAYYGQVAATDVAQWWALHGTKLFSRNLRHLVPVSPVNDSIVETLLTKPDHFWYFNNGITVLCDRVDKLPIGGNQRRTGQFRCTGVSVVNGAQTVGAIQRAASRDPDRVSQAWVLVRFISLDNGPAEFATEVTRATNTQNRVEAQDFVSLDPQQQRLRRELELDGHFYALKTGEDDVQTPDSCSVKEATVALACADADPGLSVTAKRELSLCGLTSHALLTHNCSMPSSQRPDCGAPWRSIAR